MKHSSDAGLVGRLLRKTPAEMRERIGRDWQAVAAFVQRGPLNTGGVWIKTISIRNDDSGCFVVIRARVGASDMVMMRQAGHFDHAISFIAYMLHSGKWKPDRYGVQASVEQVFDDYGPANLNTTDTI